MSTLRDVLELTYNAFNARDVARLRPLIHPDVVWPNTLADGPPLVGKEAMLGNLARIFATIRPSIDLIRVLEETGDAITVEAQYAIEGADGRIWTDSRATLTYHFRDGLLSGMTIVGGL